MMYLYWNVNGEVKCPSLLMTHTPQLSETPWTSTMRA